MPKTVIICDDKKTTRNMLEEAIREIENVQVIAIEHPDHLDSALRANHNAAVLLMDLQFPIVPDGNEMDMIGHKYLPGVRSKFPKLKIIVVTSFGSDVYDILLECSNKNLQDEWIDIGKLDAKEEIRARVEPLLYPFGPVSRNGLWILHLSDLHFGNSAKFSYWGLAEDGALFRALRTDLIQSIPDEFPGTFGGKSDLALVTGDITHNARDEEYDKAHAFLASVSKECLDTGEQSEDLKRVIVIPGNHDVNWDISRARSIVKKGKGYQFVNKKKSKGPDKPNEMDYLAKYAFAPFDQFQQKAGLPEPKFNDLWNLQNKFSGSIWTFPEFGFKIYGFNTSAESVNHMVNRPIVDPSVITKMDDFQRKSGRGKPALPQIALLHHSLGSATSGSDRVNNDVVDKVREGIFQNLGASINLTGHVHKNVCETLEVCKKNILFIGAGSAGAAKEERDDQPLHYNLINIRPADQVEGHGSRITVYSRILLNEKFVKNPNDEKSLYEWGDISGWVRK